MCQCDEKCIWSRSLKHSMRDQVTSRLLQINMCIAERHFKTPSLKASVSADPFWTDIPLFSVCFEVAAQLQAGITETWPTNSRDEGRENHFPAAHWDSNLTFATVAGRAQRVFMSPISRIWQSQFLHIIMTEEKCVYAELIHRPQLYPIVAITNNVSSVFVQQSSQPAYIDQTLAPQQGRST